VSEDGASRAVGQRREHQVEVVVGSNRHGLIQSSS
jgi:hypothetical protein